MTSDQDRASEIIAKITKGESIISLPDIDLTKVNTNILGLLHRALKEGFVILLKSQANIVEEIMRRANE